MKIPLYILGFLKRHGSLHGYKLKELITERISDFTTIKLPAIYYHLDKMEKNGLITAVRERQGKWPERSVYTITQHGIEAFQQLLSESLSARYRPEFDLDASLFFADSLTPELFAGALQQHTTHCETVLERLNDHKAEVLRHLPPDAAAAAISLFHHHEIHYQAELEWLRATAERMQ